MRFRLLQARLRDDPVREEERLAFAIRLDVSSDQVEAFDVLSGRASHDRIIDGVDAILVGGSGAFSVLDDVPWMASFVDTLGGLADSGFPTFASCFGFQGMVVALGGEVVHDEERSEVGSFELRRTAEAGSDPLFAALPHRFVAQLGHKDRASRLPSSLINLAESDRCPFQAFRVEGKPVYATQFHPELTREDNLLRMERYFDMYAEAFGAGETRRMMDAFLPSPESNALLRQFRAFVSGR